MDSVKSCEMIGCHLRRSIAASLIDGLVALCSLFPTTVAIGQLLVGTQRVGKGLEGRVMPGNRVSLRKVPLVWLLCRVCTLGQKAKRPEKEKRQQLQRTRGMRDYRITSRIPGIFLPGTETMWNHHKGLWSLGPKLPCVLNSLKQPFWFKSLGCHRMIP